jgi:hypothetical protein
MYPFAINSPEFRDLSMLEKIVRPLQNLMKDWLPTVLPKLPESKLPMTKKRRFIFHPEPPVFPKQSFMLTEV